jgi:hypothetical protein
MRGKGVLGTARSGRAARECCSGRAAQGESPLSISSSSGNLSALKAQRRTRNPHLFSYIRDVALSTQFTAHIAATAASATALSCSPVPPLTPTAPTTSPLCRSGTPPVKIMMRPPLEACIP